MSFWVGVFVVTVSRDVLAMSEIEVKLTEAVTMGNGQWSKLCEGVLN